MLVPLIGVTDFMNFEQVETMSAVFKKHLPQGSQRRLHVGVMMSYKTLHDLPNRWQNHFPPKEDIASIFSSDDVYNCLHFADYDGHPELWKSLSRAISYGGIGIHALQLDMIWPDPSQIDHAVHISHKQIEVILQIGKKAFKKILDDPKILIKKLELYEGIIHRVLLDKSGGHGVPVNANQLLPFMRAIKKNFPQFGLIVAGGLGPNTLDLLEPVLQEFPDVSIDAQTELHLNQNIFEPIDWDYATPQYLIKALKLLK